jgi:S-adenosylmethionine:tRNA ribosyltransferase-isomerase
VVVPLAAFHYDLPEAAVAQVPIEPRDAARLLVDAGPGDGPAHHRVRDLPDLLGPGDLLVVNETRVLPARLRLRKATGGEAEVLLLERGATGTWLALARPGRRLPPGTRLAPEGGGVVVEVGERVDGGRRVVRLLAEDGSPLDPAAEERALGAHGAVPLPPYLHEPLADPDRYQTVYASQPGSVAAPTAGLHLTDDLLARCRARGADLARVDLAVGLDTFRPVTAEKVEDHVMHSERYRVPAATLAACAAAERVVAVGTTTVRALESAALQPAPAPGGALEGRTDLFIRDGFDFRVVDALLTNFHLPGSTLLVLLQAFMGPRWRDLYATALAEGYRFLSFGDAMLVGRGGAGLVGRGGAGLVGRGGAGLVGRGGAGPVGGG